MSKRLESAAAVSLLIPRATAFFAERFPFLRLRLSHLAKVYHLRYKTGGRIDEKGETEPVGWLRTLVK